MSQAAPATRRLLNATAVMASGTMISRLLGLVRAMMIAAALGNVTLRANEFTIALTVPNTLYVLLAGGALNNVLVPQIVRAIKKDEDQGKAFVDRIMTGFLIILAALAVFFTIAVPFVMSIYTPDLWRTQELSAHWQSLLLMSYITMPQIFFYGMFFLIGQVLNARDKFGPMMWAPIINNVVAIGVFGIYLGVWGSNASEGDTFSNEQAVLLAVSSTLGIALQTCVLFPYLRKVGFSYRPRFDLRHTGLGRTFHIAKWMVGYVALTTLAQIVVQRLASTPSVDPITHQIVNGLAVNPYQNGYLIWILPHSLITVSLATAMLPQASRYAVAGKLKEVAEEISRTVRMATTFLVPACLGFLVLAEPISALIYSHGAGNEDYHVVAWTLSCFAVGLVPFTIQFLYLRAFYALDNTRSPFLLQLAISGANICLAVVLVWSFNSPTTVAPRLALAYSLAYFVGIFITHRALKQRLPDVSGSGLARQLVRLLVAALPAAALAFGATWGFSQLEGKPWQIVGLLVAAVVAVVAFFLFAKLLHIAEANELMSVLRRRTDDEELLAAGEAELEVAGPGDDEVPAEEIPSGPLTYPDTDTRPIAIAAELPHADQMLANRYRLDWLLSSSGTTQTWRAFDESLERFVLIHLLPVGDPRATRVLAVAKQAATATDARILRVLDIVGEETGHGAYLVSEYAAGQTLAAILASGPLSSTETAWVVREIADALTLCHAEKLYHRHLNPTTILITANGHVKLTGMFTDEARGEIPAVADEQAADVQGLGKLIFACLTAHWPGADRFGLPGAGSVKLPSEVVKVPPELDSIVDRILSANPKRWAPRLMTAAEVTTALSLVLGPVSAAQELRTRLDLPTDEVPISTVVPPTPAPLYPADESEAEDSDRLGFVSKALDEADVFTPVPPPVTAQVAKPKRKPWVSILVIVVGLIILAIAIITTFQQPAAPGVAQPSATPLAVPTLNLVAVKITSAKDFDPKADGGSGGENGSTVKNAFDNKPKTSWRTESYKGKSTYGGLKPGTGLVLDLKEPVKLAKVELELVGASTDIELLVPKGKISQVSIKDWRKVAEEEKAGEDLVITLPQPITTRYLLVYLTSLPKDGNSYRGGISEIRIFARE